MNDTSADVSQELVASPVKEEATSKADKWTFTTRIVGDFEERKYLYDLKKGQSVLVVKEGTVIYVYVRDNDGDEFHVGYIPDAHDQRVVSEMRRQGVTETWAVLLDDGDVTEPRIRIEL